MNLKTFIQDIVGTDSVQIALNPLGSRVTILEPQTVPVSSES